MESPIITQPGHQQLKRPQIAHTFSPNMTNFFASAVKLRDSRVLHVLDVAQMS